MSTRIVLIALLLVQVFQVSAHSGAKHHHTPLLKSYDDRKLKMPEPSDIVFDAETGNYFIVSDHGKLYECDSLGNIIRKAQKEGLDFEGVEIKDGYVYVSDETPRKVYKYKKSDLSLVDVYTVSWAGAMNKAFESIAYNEAKGCFVLVSQEPAVIIEYDKDFKELKRHPFHYARDISSARWYNGYLYLLSSKDCAIFKCNPETYEVLDEYRLNIINPEGLAFSRTGDILITSDDLQRLFFIKTPKQ